jgi:hypothetical protein
MRGDHGKPGAPDQKPSTGGGAHERPGTGGRGN